MYYVGEHSQIMNATFIDFLTIQTLSKKAISKILSQNWRENENLIKEKLIHMIIISSDVAKIFS